MDLRHIIDEIVSQADDFLAEAKSRELGRTAIKDLISSDYAQLSPVHRKKVLEGVMAILEDDDFFGTQYASGAFDEEDSDSEAST